MKMLVLAAFLIWAWIAGAQTNSASVSTNSPFVKRPQFPERFTNSDGSIYRYIRFQQVYPEGIAISYLNDDSVREMEVIKWKELSPKLKSDFGYDAHKEAAYEAKEKERYRPSPVIKTAKSVEQLWDEYDFAVDQRQWEKWADQQRSIAQANKAEQDRLDKAQVEADAKQREQFRQDVYDTSWRAAQKSAEDNARARDLWYQSHPDQRPLNVGDLPYSERYKHYP